MLLSILLLSFATLATDVCSPGTYYLSEEGRLHSYQITSDCKVLKGPALPVRYLQDEYHLQYGTRFYI